MLRTGYKSEAEQAQFYRAVICNPNADHRYYAIESDGLFVGMGGLTYLSRTPGEAEISLILGPSDRGTGLGSAAVDALVEEAQALGLGAVIGECYASGNIRFWTTQITKRPARIRWEWAIDGVATNGKETR